MSEQTSTQAVEQTNGTESTKAPKDYGKVCATEAELKEVPCPEKGMSFMVILHEGAAPVYLHAPGYDAAYQRASRAAGGSCTRLGKTVSKEQLAAGLAALSPEDRAVLIAQYVPAGKGKKGSKE
jgi:hypothetical protein